MTCQDPAKCGTGIKQGQQAEVHLRLLDRHRPSATAEWQTYKSDASKAGIDISLVGQTFNTIIGEGAPCAPMGPKCNVPGLRLRRLGLRRPGLRADRRAAVRDRRRLELRQLLRPEDGPA